MDGSKEAGGIALTFRTVDQATCHLRYSKPPLFLVQAVLDHDRSPYHGSCNRYPTPVSVIM
jgi:hypothetical protein